MVINKNKTLKKELSCKELKEGLSFIRIKHKN